MRKDLPERDIAVVHRRDGSGTTRVLTEFLRLSSKAWARGADWWWAVGGGEEGSEALAMTVGTTPYSIGYVEYGYALKNGLRHAFILNSAEQYVQANADSIDAAISDPQTQTTLRNEQLARAILADEHRHHDAYPITALTWVAMPVQMSSRAGRALLRASGFFPWTMTPAAQAFIELFGYVRLNSELLAWERKEIGR